jgi:hypothetical protein
LIIDSGGGMGGRNEPLWICHCAWTLARRPQLHRGRQQQSVIRI